MRPSPPIAAPLLAAALLAVPAAAFDSARAPQLDRMHDSIAQIVADWRVPGMAIAVVVDGEVVLAEGFGVREVGLPEPVTIDTLFSIGSATKSFTAGAIGLLVEDGRLTWDDPVARYLKGFAMPDGADTDRVTVRDLLAHRTGLAGGDLISWGSTFSRQDIVERLRFLEPASPLRSEFHYSNNVYVAAGEVIPSLTGRSWEETVSERLLAPLGMARTVTGIEQIPPQAQRAAPHAVVDGQIVPIPPMNEDNCAAAGAIWSTAADMARWIRMLLAGGELDGGRVLRPATLSEMWEVQVPIRTDEEEQVEPAELRARFAGYGLGWFLRDYRGRKLVSHDGQSDGMVSQVALIPEQGIGLVILLNLHESDAFEPVAHVILDSLLGVPDLPDWNQLYLEAEATSATPEPRLERDSSEPLSPGRGRRLRGRYANPAVGAAEVHVVDGSLSLLFERTPLYGGRLDPTGDLTFIVRRDYPLVGSSALRFHADEAGRITGFTLEPDETHWLASLPYHFERIEDTPGGS